MVKASIIKKFPAQKIANAATTNAAY